MKKGVVIEVNERYVTLMTPDGEFVQTKNVRGSYQIGEEITFYPSNQVSTEYKKAPFINLRSLKVQIASVLAVILLFIMTIPIFQQKEVYAYMSIDINPSFELEINEALNVLSVTPLNEDAKDVISKINDWKNKSIKIVTQKIIDRTKQEGYLKDHGEVLIATVVKGEEEAAKEKLQTEIKNIEVELEKQSYDITSLESDETTREKAQKEGLSTGKYIERKEHLKVQQKEVKKEQPEEKEKKVNTPKQEVIKNNENKKEKGQVEQPNSPPGQQKKEVKENKQSQNNKQKEAKTPPGQLKKEEKKNENKKNGRKEDKDDDEEEEMDENELEKENDEKEQDKDKENGERFSRNQFNNNQYISISFENYQIQREQLKNLKKELKLLRKQKREELNFYLQGKLEEIESLIINYEQQNK